MDPIAQSLNERAAHQFLGQSVSGTNADIEFLEKFYTQKLRKGLGRIPANLRNIVEEDCAAIKELVQAAINVSATKSRIKKAGSARSM